MSMIAEQITSNPNPMNVTVIYRAQSMLTDAGKIGPVLTYGCAKQIIAGIHKHPSERPSPVRRGPNRQRFHPPGR